MKKIILILLFSLFYGCDPPRNKIEILHNNVGDTLYRVERLSHMVGFQYVPEGFYEVIGEYRSKREADSLFNIWEKTDSISATRAYHR